MRWKFKNMIGIGHRHNRFTEILNGHTDDERSSALHDAQSKRSG
jgi:hypothetical protein